MSRSRYRASQPRARIRGLVLTIKAGFLGFVRRVEVEAVCLKNGEKVDPYVGCPDDHPGLDIFRQALEGSDD